MCNRAIFLTTRLWFLEESIRKLHSGDDDGGGLRVGWGRKRTSRYFPLTSSKCQHYSVVEIVNILSGAPETTENAHLMEGYSPIVLFLSQSTSQRLLGLLKVNVSPSWQCISSLLWTRVLQVSLQMELHGTQNPTPTHLSSSLILQMRKLSKLWSTVFLNRP